MGSSPSGNYQPGSSPTPGNSVPFGQASNFNPSFINVLKPNAFTSALPDDFGAQQAAANAPPPMPAAGAGGGGGGVGNVDAFAQQLMDWRRGAMANPLYGMQHAPTAQGPAQQLMLSAAQSDPRNRLASLMGAYNARGVSSGGGGNRGGYSSSRS
jgi:hypothetical protein